MKKEIKETKMTWENLLIIINQFIEYGYLDPKEEVIIFDENKENNRYSKILIPQESLYLDDEDFTKLNYVELIGRTNNKQNI